MRLNYLVALLLLAALPVLAAPEPPRRFAVIIGISSYDASTRVPQLPQAEASARLLANRVKRAYGVEAVRLELGRVTAARVVETIRAMSGRARGADGLLVALICAGDKAGLVASDGLLKAREVREAVVSVGAQSVVVLADAGASAETRLVADDGRRAQLSSARADQDAWPLFTKDKEGAVTFLSAASAGWADAFKREDGHLQGDLGGAGCLSVEDLKIRADMQVAAAMPAVDAPRWLDGYLARTLLEMVSPALVRRARRPQGVSMAELRNERDNFDQLAALLHSLRSRGLKRLDDVERHRIEDAVTARSGDRALREALSQLLKRGLLASPVDDDDWKRLEAPEPQAFAILAPVRQEGDVSGEKDLAVTGPRVTCQGPLAYGCYVGTVDGHRRVKVDLTIFGTALAGTWEGDFEGDWLRGQWVGRYDTRDRMVRGRIVSALGFDESKKKRPATFEGEVSKDGGRIEGTWRWLDPQRYGEHKFTLQR
ncbi:MAG: hypothetical protein FJX76_06850 [Armatimonadetes bacterium]|nr:hypothetical protein [Armatimonadota bacterium]